MGVDSLWSQTDNGENLLNQQEKFTSITIRMGNLPALCQMSKKRQGYIVVNLKKKQFFDFRKID
jgi:predicted nucleic acid-binding OB-fold protein